jgi:hypothetical protein
MAATATTERLERPLQPALAATSGRGCRVFVASTLATCFVLLAGVLAFNVAVDPYAVAGTRLLPPAVETDRSVKLNLIADLVSGPQVVILGSSRARQAEPSYVHRLTGLRAFNAAVTGGTAADAWVMSRYIAERFPHVRQRYIWFVDSGIATNGINPQLEEDPRGRRYLAGRDLRFTLADVGAYLGFQATRSSWRVVDACVFGTCRTRLRYLADGGLAGATLRYLPERARSLRKSVAALVAGARAHPTRAGPLNPIRYTYFERAIRFMNARGVRPVIVLNPIYPSVLAVLREQGLVKRRRAMAYLRALHRRLDFVVVDCQDIRSWGGSAKDWTNATHVNRRNMRRMLRYIVANARGALG